MTSDSGPAVHPEMKDEHAPRRAGGREQPGLIAAIRDFFHYTVPYHFWSFVMILASPFGETFLYVLYRKDLTKPLRPFKAKVPITVARAEPEEIDDVVRIESADDEALFKQFRAWARRGHMCFVASVGEEKVAYDWACVRPEWVPGGMIAIKAGEVYCTDAYTAEHWRGHRIHSELNYWMLRGVQEAGYRTAYTIVNVVNPNSWKAMRRVGWEVAGTMLFFKGHRSHRVRTWRLSGSLYPCVSVRGPGAIRKHR
jgi:L-amino acid N-acyltransferase YncA